MACLCISGNINANEQSEQISAEAAEKKVEITAQEFADLLEMTTEEFFTLLAAAEIEVIGLDDFISDDKKIKLLKFLQNLATTNKEFDNTDCKPGEMLFCETERRVSDQRFGRNKMANDKRCACGPMSGRF
jgi:DNA-directed RNA polymerase specialized sigma subunit